MTQKSKARPAAQASSGSPVQLELFESKPAQDESPLPDADEPFELTPLSEFDGTAMKMGRHRLETLELARELYARGASYKTVAASLHVSVYTARAAQHAHARLHAACQAVQDSGRSYRRYRTPHFPWCNNAVRPRR